MKKIKTVRTGGQSGADRAAMDTALRYHIDLCGWCPRGGWAEDYPDAPGLLADYPQLTETPSPGTAQRTVWNMRDADAILTIMPEGAASAGTDLGLREGIRLGKPMYTAVGMEDAAGILAWLESLPDGLDLCVGGPRQSECENAYRLTEQILDRVFREVNLLFSDENG